MIEEIGLEGERLDMFFMSGSQAHAFAAAAHTMTERVRKLGPNPLRPAPIHEQETAIDNENHEEDESGFRGRKVMAD